MNEVERVCLKDRGQAKGAVVEGARREIEGKKTVESGKANAADAKMLILRMGN